MQQATIIGAAGFVGSALLRRLHALGWHCNVPARSATWRPQGELGHLFYCAGLTADYARRPVDTVEAHVGLLSRVLESGRFESLVYLSSTRLYDGQPQARGAAETGAFLLDPGHARNLYDLSKLLGENLCSTMGNGRARVARLACVYQDDTDLDGFLPGLLRQVLACPPGATVQVDSSPGFERDYVHVDDVVDALIRIALHGRHASYNVATGVNVSNQGLAAQLARLAGVHLRFSRSDQPAPALRVDNSRLTEALDWHPRSLEDALCTWAMARGLKKRTSE
jgi:nucleoside-diphosphate-sugar epimerase